jgi:predicted aconitase with swiveling domain
MKQFTGRIIVPVPAKAAQDGKASIRAEALVSRQGFNTLAGFQKALMFRDKKAACSDQNNADLYGKPMAGKALCLPQTIGSTTGGMVLFCAAALEQQPACLLFSKPIDSLAAAGAILAGVWTEHPMPTIDSLGDEFLATVRTGSFVTVDSSGPVTVE